MILLLLPPIARQIEEDAADFFSIPMAILIFLIDLTIDYFDPAEDDEFDDW